MLSLFGGEKDNQRLMTASRTLYDCAYVFVSSTNTIFRMLNQHLGTEFPNLAVRENLSIKENLQLLMGSLKEMHEMMESKDKDIQQCVSQSLYSKIIRPSSSSEEKISLAKDIYSHIKGPFASISGPVVAILLKQSNLPEKLETALRELAACPALFLRVSDLLMSLEEIAKVLPETSAAASSLAVAPPTGSRIRSQSIISTSVSLTSFMQVVLRGQSPKNNLKLAADSVEEAIKVLKPACDNFQKAVKMIEEYVTLIMSKLQ